MKKKILLLMALAGCMSVQAQGLKDVYKDYFMIGVAVNQRNVSNPEQAALVKKEFNTMKSSFYKMYLLLVMSEDLMSP